MSDIAERIKGAVILSASRSMGVEAFAHMLRLALSMTPYKEYYPLSKINCSRSWIGCLMILPVRTPLILQSSLSSSAKT